MFRFIAVCFLLLTGVAGASSVEKMTIMSVSTLSGFPVPLSTALAD